MRGPSTSGTGAVIPTFHPAAILRSGGDGSRQFEDLRDDFRLVRQTLDGPREPPAADAFGVGDVDPVVEPQDDQLELF